MSTSQPARCRRMPANRPLIEPPMIRTRRVAKGRFPRGSKLLYHRAKFQRRNAMALTMLDKKPVAAKTSAWPDPIAAEFEREKKHPNGCVGQRLLSESD